MKARPEGKHFLFPHNTLVSIDGLPFVTNRETVFVGHPENVVETRYQKMVQEVASGFDARVPKRRLIDKFEAGDIALALVGAMVVGFLFGLGYAATFITIVG